MVACDVLGHDVSVGISQKIIIYSYCARCKRYNVGDDRWLTKEEFDQYVAKEVESSNEVP